MVVEALGELVQDSGAFLDFTKQERAAIAADVPTGEGRNRQPT